MKTDISLSEGIQFSSYWKQNFLFLFIQSITFRSKLILPPHLCTSLHATVTCSIREILQRQLKQNKTVTSTLAIQILQRSGIKRHLLLHTLKYQQIMDNPETETGAVTDAVTDTNKDTDCREGEATQRRCLQIGIQMAYLLGPNTCTNWKPMPAYLWALPLKPHSEMSFQWLSNCAHTCEPFEYLTIGNGKMKHR